MNEIAQVTLVGDIIIPPDGVVLNCNFAGRILGNLEAPICSERISKRPKAGPCLTSCSLPPAFRGGIVSLANNHAMDYGSGGLQDTFRACQFLNIETVGAGENLEAAQRPLIFQTGNIRVGVLARCETQFGTAGFWNPGVATLDPAIYKEIKDLKDRVDVVIISIHGSAEMSPWPSPRWQSLLRSFIDAGATVVHGHHSHVPQGYEEYNNGLIFYGLGNFIVDPKWWEHIPNALWSLISDIEFSQKGIAQYHLRTVTIKKVAEKAEIAESTQAENRFHKQYLERVCSCLFREKLLLGLWQETSIKLYHKWYAPWLGFRVENLLNPRYNNLRRYHLFACESHRDAVTTALGVLSGEICDMRTLETKTMVSELMPIVK